LWLSSDAEDIGLEVLNGHAARGVPQTAIAINLNGVAIGNNYDRGFASSTTLADGSTRGLVLVGVGGGWHVASGDCQDAAVVGFIEAITHNISA
jgi:hypothetical protein